MSKFKIRCTDCGKNLDYDTDLVITIDKDGEEVLHCPACNSTTFIEGWTYHKPKDNPDNYKHIKIDFTLSDTSLLSEDDFFNELDKIAQVINWRLI